ncbi:MAG: PhoH family protein, partial [Candidatus Caldatribacterium sp.]|nr:PhoH family protein [Candidatus Caldatribacterium sp.]
MVWLRGGFGTGKTALAVAIAIKLVEDNFVSKIISNIPIFHPKSNTTYAAFDHYLLATPDRIEDCVLVIDEAGNFYSRYRAEYKTVDALMTFLRKKNVIVLLPSIKPVFKDLAQVTIYRFLNLQAIIAIPFWIYKAQLAYSDYREKKFSRSTFVWRNPTAFFPYFDSAAQPINDLFIAQKIVDEIKELEEEYEFVSIPIYQSPTQTNQTPPPSPQPPPHHHP